MMFAEKVQKRSSSGRELGSLRLVEVKEATISKIFETGEDIPLRSSHQHSGGESVKLDGLPAHQKETQLVRRERVLAAFPQGQYRALIL